MATEMIVKVKVHSPTWSSHDQSTCILRMQGGADGVVCLFSQNSSSFDAESLFLDSSAVKKRTFIPVVGEILIIRCSKKLLHVSNLYSAARM